MIDLTRTTQLVRDALFDPEPTWRSYLPEAGDWQKTARLLTVPLVVGAAVLAFVLGLLGSGVSAFGFRPTLGGLVLGIVWGLIAAGVVAFIFSFLAGVFGGKNSFALGLAATTLAFVPGYAGQVLGALPWVGWLLSLALGIYSLILLWRIIPLYLEVPDVKRTMHYIVSLIATVIAFVVLSTLLGAGAATNQVVTSRNIDTDTVGGGMFGGVVRQAELVAAAEEDRYQVPANGRLSERQVEAYIRVMQRTAEAYAAREQQVREIAERSEAGGQVSFRDIANIMSGAAQVSSLGTVEVEIVKTAGGNWAEHQWVKESLRTAWLQKDSNDAVEHNYALYQKYEDQLSALITP